MELVFIAFFLSIPFHFIKKLSCFENALYCLQAFLCWIPIYFFSYYWFLIFPELYLGTIVSMIILLFVISINHFFSVFKLLKTITTNAILPFCLIFILIIIDDVPLVYAFVNLICIIGIVVIVKYLSNKQSLGMPSWIPISILSLHASVICLTYFIYTCDQISLFPKIISQSGIQGVKSESHATENQEIPFHDISSFLVHRKDIVLFPRHLSQMIFPNNEEKKKYFKTNGVFADNIILDYEKNCFYSVAGIHLYEGNLKDMSVSLLHEFNPSFINPARTPNYIRSYPSIHPKRFLIQFDLNKGVFIYDKLTDTEKFIHSQYYLTESIWHPDGDKIIAYGGDETGIKGHFIVMDMNGKILVHRVVMPFDDISLTPTTGDKFFAAFFFNSKVEQLSVDTLKTFEKMNVPVGPRSLLISEKFILVPSYIKGTLSVYRKNDKSLVHTLLIGKRVRSIIPTHKSNCYWLSSSAGQFVVDLNVMANN